MTEFDLSSMSAESLLMMLAKRQQDAIDAEAEEARVKARMEAIQGVVLDNLRKDHPVEVAKKLMWGDESVRKAHEDYLEGLIAYKTAQAAQVRAKEALGLWQTLRADARKA